MRRAPAVALPSDLLRAERFAADRYRRLGLDIDMTATSAVANVFRASGAARGHLERTVLASEGLSFTAFTVLWVLWVGGEIEFRHLATEAAITKGTLTGVLNTLERRDLVARRRHERDRRLMTVSCAPAGDDLMIRLFPKFNDAEREIVSNLDPDESSQLADLLRKVVRSINERTPASTIDGGTSRWPRG